MTTSRIHPTAIIDPQAELDSSVKVGAYSLISAGVQIAADTEVMSHVVIKGATSIGKRNRIYQFASLGEISQDKKYKGEENTYLSIGNDNEIREYCSMNRGTVQGGGYTRVGNHNWIMASAHIAHDCQVKNHTIFANGASLAGHVVVDDYAILGGFSGIHQFCNVGQHCFVAAGSIILKDVLPFVIASGYPATTHGLNLEGLKRRGFSKEVIRCLRQAYKIIYRQHLTTQQAIAQLTPQVNDCTEIHYFIDALKQSSRGIVR